MKDFIRFIFSKLFLKHLLFAILGLILLIILTFLSLRFYTRHGDSQEVPDFSGLTESQFAAMVENHDMRYTIVDSVHVANVPPGVVIDQSPKPGDKVKTNRTIFITINAVTPEKVLMPKLIDYSYRNAEVMLESFGLKIGKLVYVPSEYANLVVGQQYEGKPVDPGTSLLRGSEIDLLVGRGLSDEKTHLPDLTNLKVEEARIYLQRVSLNVGTVVYDASVVTSQDSAAAVVWKQNPSYSSGVKLQVGSSVDIWATLDSSRISVSGGESPVEEEEISF